MDPDGRTTIVDEKNKYVVSVVKDGRTDVLAYPFSQNGKRYEGPGMYYGKTMYVDSFISPDTGNPVGIVFPKDSIDVIMACLSMDAIDMGYTKAWIESRSGGKLDIKSQLIGHEGKSYHGFVYKGYIITLREAGNILAGQNAACFGLEYSDFQKGAGALQQANLFGVLLYKVFGKEYGESPYYGENYYQYRSSMTGYNEVINESFVPFCNFSLWN